MHELKNESQTGLQTIKMEKIDFVITWVDDSDPVWQNAFRSYLPKSQYTDDIRYIRYRNWDNLRYWFRGVEKFAPWVNKIHFITCGQIPDWLNLEAPKLRFVKHSDYIPDKYLPTFNSDTIILNLHRIEGLSEHFVFFDDDMFLLDKVGPERFFRNGLPCDLAAFNALSFDFVFMHNIVNDIRIINSNFNKREMLRKHFRKWFSIHAGSRLLRTFLLLPWYRFSGFCDPHLPQVFLKSTFEEVWERHKEILLRSTAARFRNISNVTSWLFRYWQLVKGDFTPLNVMKDGKFFEITDDSIHDIVKTIEYQKKRIICLNDGEVSSFETARDMINAAFHKILPEKSSFEK